MNTPRERAIRVLEQRIYEAQEKVDDLRFVLAALRDADNMDKEFPYEPKALDGPNRNILLRTG